MGHIGTATDELISFRSSFHRCLSPWGDALFELTENLVRTGKSAGARAALAAALLDRPFQRAFEPPVPHHAKLRKAEG